MHRFPEPVSSSTFSHQKPAHITLPPMRSTCPDHLILLDLMNLTIARQLITVAAQSKAWVYGRSLAGTADSNPAGGMNVHLL